MLDLPKILVYNVNINFLEVFMKPNYVAKKSAWTAVSIWTILLCWLIVPIIIMIFKIIALKAESIEFYDQKVVQRSGILAKQERANLCIIFKYNEFLRLLMVTAKYVIDI